jgi:hypothetical protein
MLDCWGAFHTGVGRAHAVYLILLTLFGIAARRPIPRANLLITF